MSIPASWGAVPPRWQVYFSVADCDRAVRHAADLKGGLITGPTEVPEIGRFGVIVDTSDAVFGVFQAPGRP